MSAPDARAAFLAAAEAIASHADRATGVRIRQWSQRAITHASPQSLGARNADALLAAIVVAAQAKVGPLRLRGPDGRFLVEPSNHKPPHELVGMARDDFAALVERVEARLSEA